MKSDIDIWLDYVKGVEKLSKPNTVAKFQAQRYIAPKGAMKKKNEFSDITAYFENKRKNHFETSILNKKERKKFRSEALIDLHGYTREIDQVLENFCFKCIINNVRSVMIISGKGTGIVKAAVRLWLENNPHIVSGFFEIKDSLGESGSFGVRLRQR